MNSSSQSFFILPSFLAWSEGTLVFTKTETPGPRSLLLLPLSHVLILEKQKHKQREELFTLCLVALILCCVFKLCPVILRQSLHSYNWSHRERSLPFPNQTSPTEAKKCVSA